ncbi:MAG: glycosyltransferase [Myxococcales bacterium]|nr:MAG: glycosyltransferase [Myxococcales bacterium]
MKSEKDSGQSNAINTGFTHATGEVFAYLNSDDLLIAPDTLTRVASFFRSYPDVGVLQGHTFVIDAQDRITGMAAAIPFSMRDRVIGIFGIPQQATFWRRDVYEAVGGFNEANPTCMDGEFYVRAALAKKSFACVDEVLAAFRVHSESISGSQRLGKVYREHLGRVANMTGEKNIGRFERMARNIRAKLIRAYAMARHHPAFVLRR